VIFLVFITRFNDLESKPVVENDKYNLTDHVKSYQFYMSWYNNHQIRFVKNWASKSVTVVLLTRL